MMDTLKLKLGTIEVNFFFNLWYLLPFLSQAYKFSLSSLPVHIPQVLPVQMWATKKSYHHLNET